MPWLLLLDEPSEGIQPSIVQEIGEILVTLRQRDKLSLLIVEQNLDLVLDVADRIVVVERGRIEREVDAHTVQAGGLADAAGHGRAARNAQRGAIAHLPPRRAAARAARRRHAACGGSSVQFAAAGIDAHDDSICFRAAVVEPTANPSR